MLYSLGIYLLGVVLSILGFFNTTFKLWNQDRKKHLLDLEIQTDLDVIWVHCASLGEFEQISPLLKLLKVEQSKQFYILLTFFSPSGYHARKNTQLADKVIYLPLDTKSNMAKLVAQVHPSVYIGVKYEFWWNLLTILRKNQVPIIYTNVVLQEKQYLFKPVFKKYKNILSNFNKIFVQDEGTYKLLLDHQFTNVQWNGDMRIDNVVEKHEAFMSNREPVLSPNTMVWGSIYPYELKMINEVIQNTPEYHHYIVPHHVDAKTIKEISSKISVPFHLIDEEGSTNVVLVDSIGLLFTLYHKANIAYVGGGMTGALHNILEPTVCRIPTAIGPKHSKYPEAKQLMDLAVVTEIKDSEELISFIRKYEEEVQVTHLRSKIETYLAQNKGATNHVLKALLCII